MLIIQAIIQSNHICLALLFGWFSLFPLPDTPFLCLPFPVPLWARLVSDVWTLDKPGGLLAHSSITVSPFLCHYQATLHHARGAFLSILLSHYQSILYHAATMTNYNGSILTKAGQTEYCSDFEHLQSSGLPTRRQVKVCQIQSSGDHNW